MKDAFIGAAIAGTTAVVATAVLYGSSLIGNSVSDDVAKAVANQSDEAIVTVAQKADDLAQMSDELTVVVDKADKATEVIEQTVKTTQQGVASESGHTLKTVYRGDKASVVPDDVFQNGFSPKGTHNDALLHTKSNATAGNFVSTSGDISIASDFGGKNGYVYVIETDNYVDINATYGLDAYFPEQIEFSIPGGIKSSEIVGAYKKQGGNIVGDLIPNPNFGDNYKEIK